MMERLRADGVHIDLFGQHPPHLEGLIVLQRFLAQVLREEDSTTTISANCEWARRVNVSRSFISSARTFGQRL